MAKRGRNQKKDNRNPKRSSHQQYVDPKDMDDDIDIFHKQRDIISLDVNDDDDGESIEDEEEPIFDHKDINDDDDDDEDDSEDGADDPDETRFATKIKRQQKFLREKHGVSDNGILQEEEEEDEDEDDKRKGWGGRKDLYHVVGHEGDSSDDEALKEEEEEILRMQREKTKNLSIEDFGLHIDEDESGRELTLEEISKGKNKVKDSLIEEVEKMDTFEEVKKDLDALSREEQMDVVYSSAPELVGLLSELNDAVEQLESRVNPLLSKVKNGGIILEGGIRYLEVKQLLLLAYCQAITFYLLLKSEGQPVRDHPVIARLVEIKGLLDKMKQLDGSLPSEVEELLKNNCGQNKVNGNTDPAPASISVRKDHASSHASTKADVQEPAEPSTNELLTMEPSKANRNKENKVKHKTDQVGVQSMEMLKLRATLEEKFKQRGAFSSFIPKIDTAQKHSKLVNGQLEAYDDFNDDAIGGLSNGDTSLLGSSKLSQLCSAKSRKRKAVSGDDDLPMRDDIGERRRKHESRVLSGAGVVSEEDNLGDELRAPETGDASDMEDGDADTDADAGVSEDDFYRKIKQKRDAKLAAKAAIYTRNPSVPSLPETVEGKRPISNSISKNRGLTRQRRKDLKNPRKKYRTKHDKEEKRRSGQVQKIKKPTRPYDGEQTGINRNFSRSVRFV